MSSSSPLEVPGSPNSSKRSLSRDSIRSSAAVSSLSIGSSLAGSARGGDDRSSGEGGVEAPLPWFLRQTKTDIHKKFQDLEWEQRKRLAGPIVQTSSSSSQWARVQSDIAAQRNRYMNVDPFANNRVQLKVPEGHDDYINASPVEVRTTKSGVVKKFIATQGPKDNTHSHIWRMVWHECASPAVVIMLTQLHEAGREKCFQYYPHSMEAPQMVVNEHDEFGDSVVYEINLLSLTEDEKSRSTIRELEVKDRASGETKKVWHAQFSVWPDFGVPEGADKRALLNLIPLSVEKNSAEASPRIIHCSAGVGRSGTFIALDHLLSELAEGTLDEVPDGKDPIEETVETLRTQRMMMVQGESQFLMLYETLREKWIERWRERMGLPPVKQASAAASSSDEGGAEGRAGSETKRGGTAEADDRDAKVARFGTELDEELMEDAEEDEEDREAKIARFASELEAELRQNVAKAE